MVLHGEIRSAVKEILTVACPVVHPAALEQGSVEVAPEVDPAAVSVFLEQFYAEVAPGVDPVMRVRQALNQVALTGTYTHTQDELTWAARVAWRNADRCVGRAGWGSLVVRDRRTVTSSAGIAAETFEHARWSTNDGRIRPAMTVFAPARPGCPGPRIRNEQIFRYADDPMNQNTRDAAQRAGWVPSGRRWDLLPLLVDAGDGAGLGVFSVPANSVLEVPIGHPDHPWLAEFGLRWYALPAITSMRMEVGGLWYSAAPFGGWYMETEIATRNLADTKRLNVLPAIAQALGLDPVSPWIDWRDRAAVLLNEAVLWSFRTHGVKVSAHRMETERFLAFIARERQAGRGHLESADWSWVVPPSACPTPAYHHYYRSEPEQPLPRLVRDR